MATERRPTRERILEAAAQIAQEVGPGNISLEAVAHKAGVSKGGLLYHFPSKSKLLEATVETFVKDYDRLLKERECTHDPACNPVAQAYIDIFVEDLFCKRPPSSGIIAALAEDPSFLNPVQRYERKLLDRIKEDLDDPELALILYLAIGGLKSSELLGFNVIQPEEVEAVTNRLRQLVSSPRQKLAKA